MSKKLDSIGSDYDLLRLCHSHDLKAIAERASRADLIDAIRWYDTYSAKEKHGVRERDARREILRQALVALQKPKAKRGRRTA